MATKDERAVVDAAMRLHDYLNNTYPTGAVAYEHDTRTKVVFLTDTDHMRLDIIKACCDLASTRASKGRR